ncbi:hypothetical protein CRENBAI_026654 [Crenichthys baileyi]|uniref:Uncharacterized protein n=1 Tax=Crenichthys baileyi TaxID=28760 RepID=A0AAV9QRD5_9TELE
MTQQGDAEEQAVKIQEFRRMARGHLVQTRSSGGQSGGRQRPRVQKDDGGTRNTPDQSCLEAGTARLKNLGAGGLKDGHEKGGGRVLEIRNYVEPLASGAETTGTLGKAVKICG